MSATDLGVKPDAEGYQSAAFQKAIAKVSERGGLLLLPAGTYRLSDTRIDRPIVIQGVGATRLLTTETSSVTLDGIGFEGEGTIAESEHDLVSARNSLDLTVRNCSFAHFTGNGLALIQCAGRVIHNSASNIGRTGIFALDSRGLDISAMIFRTSATTA
jgi:hypothetical protein